MLRKFRCIRTCYGFRDQLYNEGDILHVEDHELDHPTLKAHFKQIGGPKIDPIEEIGGDSDDDSLGDHEIENPKKKKKGKAKAESEGTQAGEDQDGPPAA